MHPNFVKILDVASVIPVLNILSGTVKAVYAVALGIINGIIAICTKDKAREEAIAATKKCVIEVGIGLIQVMPLIGNLFTLFLGRERYQQTQKPVINNELPRATNLV